MKPIHFLVCATAVIALAGCNSKQGNESDKTPIKLEQVPPPKGGDWTQVVSQTQAGYLMGNPDAKVKLVEIGALTCPHCREFDETGVPTLVDKYVKSGQVSWEFRPYLLHGLDLPANLIASCNGPGSFFPLTRALYKDQVAWVGKFSNAPKEQLQQLETLPENQFSLQVARFAGLQEWAAVRGVAPAKSTTCLTNAAAVDQLVQNSANVTNEFPNFPGTPTFVLNGKMVENVATWELLEPKLREALR